ncbi:hypothetical protein BGZ83_009156 [Gryganskiella cystojenkinii]|nr:hypothetical protein BGZ83_009156 [Gryganskiella cystojenkinii]
MTSTATASSSSSSSIASPFGSIMFHSSKKDRRGSHIGFTRAQLQLQQHNQHPSSARIFASYSMSSSARMVEDDESEDSEDSYLVREAFKQNRTVRSPLLTSTSLGFALGLIDRKDSGMASDASTPVRIPVLPAVGTSQSSSQGSLPTEHGSLVGRGYGTTDGGTARLMSGLLNASRLSSSISSSSPSPSNATTITRATTEEKEENDEAENEDKDMVAAEDIEIDETTQDGQLKTHITDIPYATSLRSATDTHPFLVSSSSSLPPPPIVKKSPVVCSASSSPTTKTTATTTTTTRRHICDDAFTYLNANDISNSLSANLTPLEIQNQYYHHQQRMLTRRRSSRRRARSTSRRHSHQDHRQTALGLPLSSSSQQLNHQVMLQQQLLSLALATPSRFGGVHPLDWDPTSMPPPPPPPQPQLQSPVHPLHRLMPSIGPLQSPLEERWHPLQTSHSMDQDFPPLLLPKLPPSAFRTVESLKREEKQEEENNAREKVAQEDQKRMKAKTESEREQDEIDRFLVFPSPTL